MAKTKLSLFLIFKALIYSCIGHDEFVSVNDLLKEYDDIKEEIKNLKDLNSNSKILM